MLPTSRQRRMGVTAQADSFRVGRVGCSGASWCARHGESVGGGVGEVGGVDVALGVQPVLLANLLNPFGTARP